MAKALALASLVLLAFSSPAHAKEIQRAVACGLDGCTDVRKPGSAFTGSPGASMPPPGPYYRIELFYGEMAGHPSEEGFYVPGSRVATSSGEGSGYIWSVPPETALKVFYRITRGLRPFPRPRFHEVAIDGAVVANPQSYERLLTLRDSGPTRLGEADWQRVEFRSARANPWTLSRIRYSPGSDILSRNLEWVKVPPRLAAAIEARSSLEVSPHGGFDWPRATGSLVVAFGLALATILLVRRLRTLRMGHA